MVVRWRLPDHIRLAFVAGALTGVVGGLLFATAHAIIIVPIWDRMFPGFVTGPLAGAAAGWALIELVPAVLTGSARRATALGAWFGAVLWLLAAPVTLVDAALRHSGMTFSPEFMEVVSALTIAGVSGGVFGWWRTRRVVGMIAGGLATIMLMIAMAGPVHIVGSSRALRIFLAVLPVAVIAGSVLAPAVRVALRPRRSVTAGGAPSLG